MSEDRTTQILNYVSAMSREIGEWRTEMRTEIAGIRSDIEGLRADVNQLRHEVKLVNKKLDVITLDLMTTRGSQRDLEQRMEELERQQA